LSENIKELWKNFHEDNDQEAREKLVKHYEPLVHYVASGFKNGQSTVIDFGDLLGAGMMGLLESIERFDPNKCIKFETFAVIRIRGAILDILRQIDWAPRMTRKKVKQAIKAISHLQIKLGRNPSESEIAEELGISLADYRKILQNMNSVRLVSLHDIIFIDEDEGISREEMIKNIWERESGINPEMSELYDEIKRIVKELPAKERLVLTLYYYEGLNLAEIADILTVTESRACQLLSQILLRLKSRLSLTQNVFET
jgi:RNA polymerase sigma factor for flagellar operon FliA